MLFFAAVPPKAENGCKNSGVAAFHNANSQNTNFTSIMALLLPPNAKQRCNRCGIEHLLHQCVTELVCLRLLSQNLTQLVVQLYLDFISPF